MTAFPVKSETFFKGDFMSSNLWVDATVGIWGTYLINKAYGDQLFDNYLGMSGLNAVSNNMTNNIKIASSDKQIENLWSFKFPNIFNGTGTGFKWGYWNETGKILSRWYVYGSLHGVYDYLLIDMSDVSPFATYGNSLIRVSPGVGFMVTIGGDSSFGVKLDVNMRYDLPVYYNGEFGNDASSIRSGLSPHIGIDFTGARLRNTAMNIGMFFDFTTYNLFKPSEYFAVDSKSKIYRVGINFTMFIHKEKDFNKKHRFYKYR